MALRNRLVDKKKLLHETYAGSDDLEVNAPLNNCFCVIVISRLRYPNPPIPWHPKALREATGC